MAVIIGAIAGHPIGSEYENRMAARPIHPYTVQGIHGNGLDGAGSIVLNGGYPEDEDFGNYVIYTGEGKDRDQSLQPAGNARGPQADHAVAAGVRRCAPTVHTVCASTHFVCALGHRASRRSGR